MLDAKFFTLLIFIAINFLIIFVVKTRTTTVISLIIAHLIAIMFFSLAISNYNSFKEIVLALVVYSMVILFLISNYNPIYLTKNEEKIKPSIEVISMVILISLAVFFSSFSIIKNMPKIVENIKNNQITKLAVSQEIILKEDSENENMAINEGRKTRLHNKLLENSLFKRSSDVILIITIIISALLLLSPKKIKSNS